MISDIFVFGALAVSSFLNIIAPISGSSTVTPFLALFTDPHTAIGLAAFYFMMSSAIRVFLFRKDIQWPEIKKLLPVSLVFAILGAFSLFAIPALYLLLIIFFATTYFLFKKIKGLIVQKQVKNKSHHLVSYLVGMFSGFLQGAGIGGSDIRNGYLYGNQLNLAQVHGTTALIGALNFFVATIVRLSTDQLSFPDLLPLVYIFPFVLIGILLGRHVVYRMNKKITNLIVIAVMVSILIFLGIRIAGLL